MRKIIFSGILFLAVFILGCGALNPLEQELVNTMDKVLLELSINPNGNHQVLSRNFDVEGDTLSGSIEARIDAVVDLEMLGESLLAGISGWESGDVSIEGDSLDITFEKHYQGVLIEGKTYVPNVSVTLSVTVYESEGFSDGN